MRYALFNNLSISLGFLLAIFAITGMTISIFMPALLTVDLAPGHGLGALSVPLPSFNPEQPAVEVKKEVEEQPFYMKVNIGDANAVIPTQEALSPSKPQENVEPLIASTGPSQVEDSPPVQLPPEVPVRILIPSIDLDAPVIPSPVEFETVGGKEFMKWLVPNKYATGWHTTSAMLGEPGNTVINGHHNAYGEVFVSLINVAEGDIIWVESEHSRFRYQITNKLILPEKYEELDVRMNNAQWLLPSVDERLTLITCWPYESNTHRLIVVARPLGREEITPNLQ
jgi:LPXTG-site transpeptidase (sortase) family protein